MSTLRTYYYRVLLPHGALKHGLLQLALERDHSARLRLEQDTEGTVLTLWRLPDGLAAAADLLRHWGRGPVRMDDLAGFCATSV
jgi:general secretion pathway protein F/type IV pilus assembly protein PilC